MSSYVSNTNVEQIFVERVRCDYDLRSQHLIKLRKEIVLREIDLLILDNDINIYENQEIIASKVVSVLKDRKIANIMVISKTQSGKTGSMCATIKQYIEDISNIIPIENIYIITGVSSCEWKEQTKGRMPESIQKRVFHRSELPKTFVDEIREKKNILLIMDEIQVAAKTNQTICKAFDNAGLLNKSTLYEKDIKILEYTATPDGTIYDLMDWTDGSHKILGDVGDGYTSSYDLYLQGRVKQNKPLCQYDKETGEISDVVFDNIREIKNDIDNYSHPLYHIVRTKNGYEQDITISNFEEIFPSDNYDFIKYDRESDINDINEILAIEPITHTIIFIKEKLRCAKTLKKEYTGILYERYSESPDDSAIIQGLIGRDTGYDNNGISICYTNIDSIIKYEKLWNSNFEDTTIKWNSKTTKYKNGNISGKNTFNAANLYDRHSSVSNNNDVEREPIIKKFKTQEEAKEYCLEIVNNGRGPNKRKPNSSGFYEATIKKVKKVWSVDEIKNKPYLGTNNNKYRFYPCYENLNDETTLQWWVIHY